MNKKQLTTLKAYLEDRMSEQAYARDEAGFELENCPPEEVLSLNRIIAYTSGEICVLQDILTILDQG